MAQRLTQDVALALLCNAIATGATLFVLIATLGRRGPAHFNPLVTIGAMWDREIRRYEGLGLIGAQCAGGISGVWLAHLMFSVPILATGATGRSGIGQWVSEAVASFGLVLIVRLQREASLETVAGVVALYITGAYWFTSSTSFANPTVTLARSFTDTFAGIQPLDAPAFIAMQLAGGLTAVLFERWLNRPR